MVIGSKTYNIDQLRQKMPTYDMFFPKKVTAGSQEAKLDADSIATISPNLHLRFDSSEQVRRGPNEIKDRRYLFLGLIGLKAYSFVEKFTHNEDDTELSEIP